MTHAVHVQTFNSVEFEESDGQSELCLPWWVLHILTSLSVTLEQSCENPSWCGNEFVNTVKELVPARAPAIDGVSIVFVEGRRASAASRGSAKIRLDLSLTKTMDATSLAVPNPLPSPCQSEYDLTLQHHWRRPLTVATHLFFDCNCLVKSAIPDGFTSA